MPVDTGPGAARVPPMAPESSDGNSGADTTCDKIVQAKAQRAALLDSFRLRAATPSHGQVPVQMSVNSYSRLAAWRNRLGNMVRCSDDGISFGAAVCLLLDIVELAGPKLFEIINQEELLELARTYPYRGKKASRVPNVLPASTSRDPRAPVTLVRDEHGAVFSFGHRWKLARYAKYPDFPWIDFCTKCGAMRYTPDEYPNTKQCQFALEPDDFVGRNFRASLETPDGALVWKTDHDHRPPAETGVVDDKADPGQPNQGDSRRPAS